MKCKRNTKKKKNEKWKTKKSKQKNQYLNKKICIEFDVLSAQRSKSAPPQWSLARKDRRIEKEILEETRLFDELWMAAVKAIKENNNNNNRHGWQW